MTKAEAFAAAMRRIYAADLFILGADQRLAFFLSAYLPADTATRIADEERARVQMKGGF